MRKKSNLISYSASLGVPFATFNGNRVISSSVSNYVNNIDEEWYVESQTYLSDKCDLDEVQCQIKSYCPISRLPHRRLQSIFIILLLFVFLIPELASAAMERSRDFYKILGVPRDATTKQIKKRYRELSKEYHPDNNPNASTEKFLDIRDAHEALTDPELRQKYDRHGEAGLDPNFGAAGPGGGFPGGSFPGGGFFRTSSGGSQQFFFSTSGNGDPFQAFFGGGGRQRRPAPPELYPQSTSAVLELHEKNFEDEIANNFVVLSNFYSAECSHCVNFKDAYENIAVTYKDIIKVAAINCRESRRVCDMNDIEELPTLKLFFKKGQSIQYNGEMSELGVKKFLNEKVPLGGQILLASNIEKWLANEVELPKVIFFTDGILVSLLMRATANEFEGRISFGMVLLGTAAGKSLRDSKFGHWKTKPVSAPKNLPAVLHVTDIDTLDGEWIPLSRQSRTVLSLVLSRIVAQKRSGQGAYAIQASTFRELTARRNSRGDCGPSDSQICILALVSKPVKDDTSELSQAMKFAAERFIKDPVKFFWVDAQRQTQFAKEFQFNRQKCKSESDCFKLVAYRPKRKKYKEFSPDTSNFTQSVNLFVENIINGATSLNDRIFKVPEIL